MTTRAFKVFILMLLFFVAVWAWRFRSRDLRSWLDLGGPPPAPADDLVTLRSKVDRVVDPARCSRALAAIYFREPLAEPPAEECLLADPPPPAQEYPPPEPFQEDGEDPPQEIIFLDGSGSDGGDGTGGTAGEPPVEVKDPPEAPAPALEKDRAHRIAAERESKGGKAEPAVTEKPDPKASKKAGEGKSRKEGGAPDPHAVPGDRTKPVREPRPAIAVEKSQKRAITHKVKPGETLGDLALRYLKDSEAWPRIFKANRGRLSDPHKLRVGTVIEIPMAMDDGDPPSSAGGRKQGRSGEGSRKSVRS